jgi:signal transduction histidine kinase
MTEAERATRSRAPRLVDVVLVLPILVIVILGTIHIPVEAGDRPMDALAYACGIIGAGSLLFWRHWGLAVVGIVAVTTAVYSAREYAGGPALLPGPLALLALGYTAPRRVGWIGAAGYVAVAVVVRLAVGDADLGPLLIIAGWAVAAVLAGQAIAARAERAAAERERVVHAQEQALANERLRIAQDLHDSVAHAMATINVQSGVAAHLLDGDTGQAKRALEAIRAASSDALDELTAILSVLRASGDGGQPDAAPRTPIGTLGDIGELVTRGRADGLAIDVDVNGDVATLPPSVSAAAYRVVQEALTNTRRHAGAAARAEVTVDVGSRGAVTIRVTDDGGGTRRPAAPPADTAGGGFGLIGMRERVESTGGSLDAKARPGGGFEVLAVWSDRR